MNGFCGLQTFLVLNWLRKTVYTGLLCMEIGIVYIGLLFAFVSFMLWIVYKTCKVSECENEKFLFPSLVFIYGICFYAHTHTYLI